MNLPDGLDISVDQQHLDIARASANTIEAGLELADALGVTGEDETTGQCEECGDTAEVRLYPVFKTDNEYPVLAWLCRSCQHERGEQDMRDFKAGRAQQEIEELAEDADG